MQQTIIIPAYNPPNTIFQLISTIHTITICPIIIIDDGSDPPISLESINCTLLRNDQNMGKGAALLKGLNYAQTSGFTHAVTLDADNQHDPEILPSFLECDENISIVLGAREFDHTMPVHRKISNKLTSNIISRICKKKILDSQCGYRRYSLQDVCSKTYSESGFQFESEVLFKLLRDNYTLKHISVPTIYSNENSAMNNFRDTFKFINLIFRYIFHS